MTLKEIATTVADLLREKKFIEAQTKFYHQDIISNEPEGHPYPKIIGKEQLLGKEKQFLKAIKVWNAYEVSEPLVSKNHFSLRMYTDITLHTGKRIQLDEIIVYAIANDKIISEQFFYNPNFE